MGNGTYYFSMWDECNVRPCAFCTYANSPKKEEGTTRLLTSIGRFDQEMRATPADTFNQVVITGAEWLNQPTENRPVREALFIMPTLEELIVSGRVQKIVINTSLKYRFQGSILQALVAGIRTREADTGIPLSRFFVFNTGWDVNYRFYGDDKKLWYRSVEWLKENGMRVHVTTMVTQIFIKEYMRNSLDVQWLKKHFPREAWDLVPVMTPVNVSSSNTYSPHRDHFRMFLQDLVSKDPALFTRFLSQMYCTGSISYLPYEVISKNQRYKCGHLKGLRNFHKSNVCALCDTIKYCLS